MRMQIKYCGYCRKGGSYNTVAFDTEAKVFSNKTQLDDKWFKDGQGNSVPIIFVEAHVSEDVNTVRKDLIKNGYQEIN